MKKVRKWVGHQSGSTRILQNPELKKIGKISLISPSVLSCRLLHLWQWQFGETHKRRDTYKDQGSILSATDAEALIATHTQAQMRTHAHTLSPTHKHTHTHFMSRKSRKDRERSAKDIMKMNGGGKREKRQDGKNGEDRKEVQDSQREGERECKLVMDSRYEKWSKEWDRECK